MQFKSLFYRHIKSINSDIVASFWAKSTMMWCMEKYPPQEDFWYEDEVAVKKLFLELRTAIEKEFLPYYFIPTINVLEQLIKQSDDNQLKKRLLDEIDNVINNLHSCISALPVNDCATFYKEIDDVVTKCSTIIANNDWQRDTGKCLKTQHIMFNI